MRLLKLRSEPTNLAHSQSNVDPGVGAQMHQHPNNAPWVELDAIEWLCIFVFSQRGSLSWGCAGIAGCHVGCFQDLLDESFLGEQQSAIIQLVDLDSQKLVEALFPRAAQGVLFQLLEKLFKLDPRF